MNGPAPMALSARGLVKRFKTGRTYVEVLKSVDFHAVHGAVTMVMGPSGSGKSTLVAALSGLLRPDQGVVNALGQDLEKPIHDAVPLLRVELRGERGRSFDVGEQDRHLLALALESATGS